MTQKLILIGFFILNIGLIGMDKEDDQEKLVKSVMSLQKQKENHRRKKLFEEFNKGVFSYFAADTFPSDKENILACFKNDDSLSNDDPLSNEKIPKDMLMIPTTQKEWDKLSKEEQYRCNEVRKFLNNDDLSGILNNDKYTIGFFQSVYRLYFKKHPKEICSVLTNYYFKDDTLIDNEDYQPIVVGILDCLTQYINGGSGYYPAKDGLDYERLTGLINNIRDYIKNFTTEKKIHFDKYKKIMRGICEKLTGAKLIPTSIIVNPIVPEEEPVQEPLEMPSELQEQTSEATPVVSESLADQAEEQMREETNKVNLPSPSEPQPYLTTAAAVSAQPEPAAEQETLFWWFDRKITEGFWGAMESISNWWKSLSYTP